MKEFTEAEKQLLIAVGWLRSRYGLMAEMDADSKSCRKNLEEFGELWIGKCLVDWSDAYRSLVSKGFLSETDGDYSLTETGNTARKTVELANPLWMYEYNNFFDGAKKSNAHALFCEMVYGKNLCQHGLADVFQLSKLLEVLSLTESDHVLDLGCGNGFITEFLQDQTQASFEGIDISAEAIEQARTRTSKMNRRLTFSVGNMNQLNFNPQTFSAAVSIDTLYYVDNLEETLKQLLVILKPEGQMGLFFTEWINNVEDKASLLPENTSLAVLLKKYNLRFTTFDLTEHEAEHWRRKVNVLEQLRPEFEKEENLDLYNYRYSEAIRYANWDLSKRSRYLYHIRL